MVNGKRPFQTCPNCHFISGAADKISQLSVALHDITSPWPFSVWAMDAIGINNPKALDRH